jgi:transposase
VADIQRNPRNGLSIRELADRIGRSPRTVQRYTSEPRETYESRAAERHTRIRALRAEGLSMRAIAEQVGVTVGAVHYALHKPDRTPE